MTTTVTEIKAPTREQLAEFVQLEKERTELESRARALASQAQPIKDQLFAWLKSKPRTFAQRLGYQIAIVLGQRIVSWKEEFVKACGADAADAISAQAPQAERLQVTPPAE